MDFDGFANLGSPEIAELSMSIEFIVVLKINSSKFNRSSLHRFAKLKI